MNQYPVKVFYDTLALPTTKCLSNPLRIDGCLLNSKGKIINLAIHKRLDYNFQVSQDYQNPEIYIEEPAYYGGIYFNHFGHFITETISRLWFYKNLTNSDINHKIFFHRENLQLKSSMLSWEKEIFKLLNINYENINFIDQITHFKEIIVPQQIIGLGGNFLAPSPPFMTGICEIIEKNINHDERATLLNFEKVYVSRSKIPLTLGRIAGESALESILRDNGYLIFHPQEHSITEQLIIYQNAKQIIFSEGSGVHLCIFLGKMSANIFNLNRRKNSGAFRVQFNKFGVKNKTIDCIEENITLLGKEYPLASALAIMNYDNLLNELRQENIIQSNKNYQNLIKESAYQDIIKYLEALHLKEKKKFINSIDNISNLLKNCEHCLNEYYENIQEVLKHLKNKT